MNLNPNVVVVGTMLLVVASTGCLMLAYFLVLALRALKGTENMLDAEKAKVQALEFVATQLAEAIPARDRRRLVLAEIDLAVGRQPPKIS